MKRAKKMCGEPNEPGVLSAREALARDLVNLPVETVSDALQMVSDVNYEGGTTEPDRPLTDFIELLNELGFPVVYNPAKAARANELTATQGGTVLPFGVPIPPEYGHIRVICPRCGASDITKCYRSGEGYAYGQCGCGWGMFKKITDEWLAEWANYCANQRKESN